MEKFFAFSRNPLSLLVRGELLTYKVLGYIRLSGWVISSRADFLPLA